MTDDSFPLKLTPAQLKVNFDTLMAECQTEFHRSVKALQAGELSEIEAQGRVNKRQSRLVLFLTLFQDRIEFNQGSPDAAPEED